MQKNLHFFLASSKKRVWNSSINRALGAANSLLQPSPAGPESAAGSSVNGVDALWHAGKITPAAPPIVTLRHNFALQFAQVTHVIEHRQETDLHSAAFHSFYMETLGISLQMDPNGDTWLQIRWTRINQIQQSIAFRSGSVLSVKSSSMKRITYRCRLRAKDLLADTRKDPVDQSDPASEKKNIPGVRRSYDDPEEEPNLFIPLEFRQFAERIRSRIAMLTFFRH